MHTSKLATSVKDLATSSTNQWRSSLQWRPPWPFAQWGLDIMGSFPTVVRQLKFLVVDIDYFTKWVEAEALAIITEKNVQNFAWRNIICRHGIPRVLISYNEKQFDNDTFRDFCSQLGIKNHYSSPTHPPTLKPMDRLRSRIDPCSKSSRLSSREITRRRQRHLQEKHHFD